MRHMQLTILRWSILGFFLALGLLPSTVFASDCPPDDPSRSDCQNAASTARSPLVPIAGAAAGGMAGWIASQALDPQKEKDGETEREEGDSKADPCQADLDRFSAASEAARVLQAAREGLQNIVNMLETQYENTRQVSFWSGGIDVAFMGGSLWTKPVAGMLGKELLEQTLGAKLRESAVKTFGQELSKALVSTMTEHGINWADVAVGKPWDSVKMTAAQEAFSKLLLQGEMQNLARRGIDPAGPVGKALERTISNEIVGPFLDGYFGLLGVYGMAEGVVDGAQKLKAIRAELSKVRKNLFDVESQFDDAVSDMAMARRTLQHCRKIWAAK